MEHIGELPEEWQEKWDPGTGRHYYWCTRTDKVSWLPPGHPKAKITEAASHVREMIQNQIHMEPDRDEDEDSEDEEEDDEHAMDLDSDMVILEIFYFFLQTSQCSSKIKIMVGATTQSL